MGTQPICDDGFGLTFIICLASLGSLWVVTNWAGSRSKIPSGEVLQPLVLSGLIMTSVVVPMEIFTVVSSSSLLNSMSCWRILCQSTSPFNMAVVLVMLCLLGFEVDA